MRKTRKITICTRVVRQNVKNSQVGRGFGEISRGRSFAATSIFKLSSYYDSKIVSVLGATIVEYVLFFSGTISFNGAPRDCR